MVRTPCFASRGSWVPCETTMANPRFPDGWNWDETSWLYFEGGRYKAWVTPKAGLFVANWRLADGSWAWPWGEDPRHIFTNPYKAMLVAAERAEFVS